MVLDKGEDGVSVSYQDALAYYRIEGAHPGGMNLTKTLLKQEKISPDTKILDAGCGTGQTSTFLSKMYSCNVFSIDNHPDMIKAATQRFIIEKLPVTINEGSIENLPYSDGFFDFVIAESSTAFADIPKALKEYFRVLKPSGALINIDMAAEHKLSKNEKTELTSFYGMSDILTEIEWINSIKQAGFISVQTLKANTVFQELEEYMIDDDTASDQIPIIDRNPVVDKVLKRHQELIWSFGEKLGYRVFKAKKISL
jgi:ubiquinone/menaquinone biosynthesis C-methylase UbiE